jgi:hypothetical protein
VQQLMSARHAVRRANGEARALAAARQAVDEAKHSLGERGPPWWNDGAPDFNRRLVKNSPYEAWWNEHLKGKRKRRQRSL